MQQSRAKRANHVRPESVERKGPRKQAQSNGKVPLATSAFDNGPLYNL